LRGRLRQDAIAGGIIQRVRRDRAVRDLLQAYPVAVVYRAPDQAGAGDAGQPIRPVMSVGPAAVTEQVAVRIRRCNTAGWGRRWLWPRQSIGADASVRRYRGGQTLLVGVRMYKQIRQRPDYGSNVKSLG